MQAVSPLDNADLGHKTHQELSRFGVSDLRGRLRQVGLKCRLKCFHGSCETFKSNLRFVDLDEALHEVDPNCDKLLLMASKKTKFVLQQCKGVLCRELSCRRVYNLEFVPRLAFFRTSDRVETSCVLEVVDGLNVVSRHLLLQTVQIIGASDVAIDALHLGYNGHGLIVAPFLAQQAVVEKKCFFEVWAQQ